MDNYTITIDMDKKCAECGKDGAQPNQLCMRCTTKAMGTKPMKSRQGKAVRELINKIFSAAIG